MFDSAGRSGPHARRMRAPTPPWRSLLFVPVTAARFVARAHERDADAVILDLEDGVAPAEKAAARAGLADAAARVGQAGAAVCVRINRPLEAAVVDIAAAVLPGVAALMLPKLTGPEHLRLLVEVIAAREAAIGLPPGHMRLIAQVETPGALPRLGAIAGAGPRVVAIGLGNEDLATEMGAAPGEALFGPLGVLVVAAARAAGVRPMGTIGPYAEFTDLAAYRAGLERSRAIGFACCACIHPAQVAVANAVFGVSPAEAVRARRLLAAFDAAVARGEGAVAFEGAMVDAPVAERARRLLAGER